MKRFFLICTALAVFAACGKTPTPTPDPDPEPVSTLVKGADISWVTELESKGYKFYNAAGQERECTALMKEIGLNAVRLRVWVDPDGGWNGKADVLVKAKRAAALGMKVMIDFHYSDSWADPGKQYVPAAWSGKDATAMAAAVKAHTQEILQALKAENVDVSWVQVGNETTNGMLWESGRVSGQNAGQFVTYFKAGREAVKAVYPQAHVILHLDNGWKLETLNWFLTLMKASSLDYDLLGLSLYPSYWSGSAYPDWNGKVKQFISNLPTLYANYGKPVMLVEFGMPASEPEKAKAALQYLIDKTKGYDYFLGIFYWEPEAEHARIGYDYGAFANGRPTAALDPFAN
ncbi:MAG: arabinogalactan endo-1,4-beta-galactosidase [Bacteroidales bacterium]|nr:arabinogalactan endo-1,4-beta-galactosidase [Bacteroidales bacterium]